MRALKILVVVMGVLIVAGTVTLAVMIVKRAGGGPGASAGAYQTLALGENPGARIIGVAAANDRLALLMSRDGQEWVVLVDPKTNQLTGRITTGAAAPATPTGR